MAVARRCDICGKHHDIYNIKKDKEETNSLIFLNTDEDNKSWQHPRVDCCPECIRAIRDLMKRRKEVLGSVNQIRQD